MSNVNAPADADIRLQALDPTQSFIVQAPAGSGKTELLTRRVLKLLTLVDEPEEVLAITFTRKAASEMRARVVETLAFAASGRVAENDYQQEGLELAQAVLQRDAERDWQLLQNVQRLNLRTIDALCTTLAHRLPFVSTLGGPAGLVDDPRPLYRKAAERMLDQNAQELDLLLLQLGNRHEHVQMLLAELLANRDQWGGYVTSGYSLDELREYLENLLQNLVESRLQEPAESIPQSLTDRLISNLSQMGTVHSAVLASQDKDTTQANLLQALDASLDCTFEDLPTWSAIATALLTASAPASLRKPRGLNKNCGFPTTKEFAELTGVSESDLKARKAAMGELLEDLSVLPNIVELLDEVRHLPPGRYEEKDWALLAQLLTMLPVLIAQLNLVFAEQSQIDFVEMTIRAKNALGTEDAPTDLALALDMKIKHILVDEFQDTSRTQFELYKQLVAGWQNDDGRTFFAVGDPMQSIYRFREGDVTLFSFAREHGLGEVQLNSLALTVNFRAAPAVVDWVNETFEVIFPEDADDMTGAVPYASSIAHLKSSGAVNIHPFIDSDVSVEAEHVALLTEQSLQSADKDKDKTTSVAILLRSRSQAGPIFAALQARGIAYQSVELELLGDRHVVRDLESLALALRYPHDRLHWLAILRAPWCALSLNDLHVLMEGADRETVFDQLCKEDRLKQLSDDGRVRVEKLLQVITPAVQRASRGALMPWVESSWLQLGGPLVCKDSIDLDAAERCIAQLRKLEQAGLLWQPSALHSSMESLYAAPSEGDAQVQVMTLHKSKGLEFDTVILPALDRKPRGDQQKILNWFDAGNDADQRLLLAPISERGLSPKDADPINGLVRRAGQLCDDQEKLRLLYVACTRAKQQLHLLARVKTNADDELRAPEKRSLLHPLWPLFESAANETLINEEARPTVESDSSEEANDAPKLKPPQLQRIPLNWPQPTFDVYQWPEHITREEAKPQDVEFLWAGTLARDVGTVVHDQLQLLSQQDEHTRTLTVESMAQRARLQLQNLGASNEQLEQAVAKIVGAVNATLSDERGQWILNPAHTDAKSEWDLSAPIDGVVKRIVIDRTFVDGDGVRWIIDYKTGDHTGSDLGAFLDNEQERYAEQLQRYADIVGRMENRPVKAALYFPLLQGWRELDTQSINKPPPPPIQAELF